MCKFVAELCKLSVAGNDACRKSATSLENLSTLTLLALVTLQVEFMKQTKILNEEFSFLRGRKQQSNRRERCHFLLTDNTSNCSWRTDRTRLSCYCDYQGITELSIAIFIYRFIVTILKNIAFNLIVEGQKLLLIESLAWTDQSYSIS